MESLGTEARGRHSYLLGLDGGERVAVDTELCGKGNGVHNLVGFILDGDLIFKIDDTRKPGIIGFQPYVLRHQELMEIPLLP